MVIHTPTACMSRSASAADFALKRSDQIVLAKAMQCMDGPRAWYSWVIERDRFSAGVGPPEALLTLQRVGVWMTIVIQPRNIIKTVHPPPAVCIPRAALNTP